MNVKIIQLVTLAFAIFGTALVFFNSPFTDSNTYIFANDNEVRINNKKDKRKRRLARLGFGLILISYVLQTIILFISK